MSSRAFVQNSSRRREHSTNNRYLAAMDAFAGRLSATLADEAAALFAALHGA